MKIAGVIATIVISLLASCASDTSNVRHDDARRLFRESVRLLNSYCDSMRTASDSASIRRIEDECRDRLMRLNMDMPAETDMYLTEGENDTLYILTKNFVIIRNRQLKKALPSTVGSDSISGN